MPAVAYGLGSNGGYTLRDDTNYKTPEMVQKLIPRASPYNKDPGAFNVADEVPSITNYYDGGNKLNTFQIQCRMYPNANDCLHQAGCGWCGSSTSCVQGNQLGPTEPCMKSTYVFTTGSLVPKERLVQENIGGLSMTIVQH
jgi:hypothetical protein